MENASKMPVTKIIHTIIGLVIMFSGHFLPNFSMVVPPDAKLAPLNLPAVDGGVLLSVTHTGMIVTLIFFGVIYLWTFVDTVWPGLLGIVALIFSGYAPAGKVFSMFLGNPMVVMIFFLLMLAAAIVYSNLAQWVARYLMSRSFVNGRPWVLTATILGTTFIVALLSFSTDPFKGGAFYLLSNLHNLAASTGSAAVELNTAAYFAFALLISICVIILLLLMMKFVYRIDVSPLKNLDAASINEEPLPPMNLQQKLVLFDFLLYAAWLLVPAIIGKGNPVGAFLARNTLTGSILVVLILAVAMSKGKPVIDIMKSNKLYAWRVFLLIAVAFLLGGIMTGKGTNVALVMEYGLRDLLGGMNYTAICICVILIGIIFTNFCNSVVLGLVLSPVLLAVAASFGVDSGPMMACFIYAVLIAACTPAASPFAALLYGQSDWIDPPAIARYTVISSGLVVLTLVVLGLPLAKMIF